MQALARKALLWLASAAFLRNMVLDKLGISKVNCVPQFRSQPTQNPFPRNAAPDPVVSLASGCRPSRLPMVRAVLWTIRNRSNSFPFNNKSISNRNYLHTAPDMAI